MFNMVYADILSFMYPGFLKEVMTGYPAASRSLQASCWERQS